MLCGRFEYFGSYWGNRGGILARIGVICGLDGWGDFRGFLVPKKWVGMK